MGREGGAPGGDRGPPRGGPGGGPGGRPGGPGGDRGGWSPGGSGAPSFRGGPPGGGGAGRPGEATSDDWADDRNKLRDRRAKKKTTTGVKAPGTAWDEDLRMRAPVKREKRESGKSWRDYTVEEDAGEVELDEDGVAIVPPADEANGAVDPDAEGESEDADDADDADDDDDDDDEDDDEM